MSDQTQTAIATKLRVRAAGENRYPNYDLNACIALAKKVKDEGYNDCTPEQLGALLGYRNTNGGGFATRVANARMFGLVETIQGRYRITSRAETILYPTKESERQQAMVDAFFSVPMYKRVYEMHKGQRLPESPLGMQNLLHRVFQIPVGDRVVQAVRVMMDSADQAGFFRGTQGKRTSLVLPIITQVPVQSGETSVSDREVKNGGSGSGGSNGGGSEGNGLPSRGKLLDGMWEELPDDASWNEDALSFWLDTFERLLRVRYKVPKS